MQRIRQVIQSFLPLESFDALSVGIIDFKNKKFEVDETSPCVYFDLASLTKPLTNSLSYFLKSDVFDKDMLLCLSHRGGLPAWGLLPNPGWREQVLSYKINETETLYSDFSALRVMLELEKKGIKQKELCQTVWDKETVYWPDLPDGVPLVQTGFKNGAPNFGEVHDPNAWVIHDFCSHAGLFSTISGLCRTLLKYQEMTGFIEQVSNDLGKHHHRFSFGWDRVVNPNDTLAGKGCGPKTFGHLGFTGTSVWIDPDRMLGHVILSNAVKYYWYDKNGLNDIRRAIGEQVWSR